MKSKSDSVAPKGPQSSRRRISGGINVSEVYGFPIVENQFALFQSDQSTESQLSTQREVGLVDPRTTRHLRWATQQAVDQEAKTKQAESATVSSLSNTQGISNSGTNVNPVVLEDCSQIFIDHSFSASSVDILPVQSVEHVKYSLDSGVNVGGGDSLYSDFKCNKRISCAGPERLAGRPGHTPTRRTLACGKLVEDSYAGQDWSAGRPGNRPFGASTAACLSPQTACLGPYGSTLQ